MIMAVPVFISNMLTSIIIIVKNDRGIEDTLLALKKIVKPTTIEIIVVDASKGSLDDIKKQFPSVTWLYYNDPNDKRFTLSEQRNKGIKNSSGEIIVFLDANCIPQKTWLVELIKPVTENNEYIVAGNVKSPKADTVNNISDERYKGTYLLEAPTLNLLIKRKVFDDIGLFDNSIIYGEDTDITWRAIDAGYKVRYAKKAVIYHDWGDLNEQFRRALRYGEVRTKLYFKHPKKLMDLYKNESIIVLIYPLFILFLPLTFLFPYYPLLIFIPILKNLKHNPLLTVLFNITLGVGVLKGLLLELIKR